VQRYLGVSNLTQGVQVDEADLVAKYAESRCSGARGIGRRSLCHGRQDSDVDDLDVLVHNQGRKYVREVRVVKAKECDAEKD
jgi:hypothetical protein